jgi:FkbM family methyltransferase
MIKEIDKNKDAINQTMNLWADDKSRFVYDHVLRYRKYGYEDWRDIMEPPYDQYFSEELISFGDNEIFVDAGVLDGATSMDFIARTGGIFDKIYAFEPVDYWYNTARNKLNEYIEEDRIVLVEKGLFDKVGKISFSDRETIGASRISETGNTSIVTTTVDEEISGPVTFIKMDIEGAELAALEGAKNKIAKYKPKLAICVYHKLADLWEIPLYIKSLAPEYKLYIRHYQWRCGETLVYAIKD